MLGLMTLIIGMKVADGLIVASDGRAAHDIRGLEHLGKTFSDNTEKVRSVSPTIMVGISGSKVNLMEAFYADITRFATVNPGVTAEQVAGQLPSYIQRLHGDKSDDPDFFIAVFVAGVGTNLGLYLVNDGKVMTWGDDLSHPWLTVGTENQLSDGYIQRRYKGQMLNRAQTVKLLKDAIANTARQEPKTVGGHTFVYAITQKDTTRLE
jgi:20S proteasome alpha/beta subunit